jgi:hypothetical protein
MKEKSQNYIFLTELPSFYFYFRRFIYVFDK